jgi:hypothetical protein
MLLQLSVTVGAVHVAVCEQLDELASLLFIVMFDGTLLITGLVLSTTVTVNDAVAVLPAASVAV